MEETKAVMSGCAKKVVGDFVDDILSEISLSCEKKAATKKPVKEIKENHHRRTPPGKLELYKSRQFYCREPSLSIPEDSEDELISCPLCLLLTKKSEYSKHVKRSERHNTYLQIEDLYLTYCDRRRINPVSCHVQELESFIQRLAWSPEENILPVWIYLASRHEANLTSFDVVRAVLESPLRRRRSHQVCPTEESMPTSYACYSCPYFCRTARDLFTHVHSEGHIRAIKAWSIRGGSQEKLPNIFTNLFCDYCDEEFTDEASLRLHRFGQKHLSGGRGKTMKLDSCILCPTDVDLNNHISMDDHKEKESMADGFLIFCYQNGLEIPLEISPEVLIRFLETLPPSTLILNVRLLRRLFGSDVNPSCPFNHKSVKVFISYTELCGSVYSPELPNKTIDLITRCGFEKENCSDTRFERITKLLYHSVSNHGLSPSDALKGLVLKIDNEESWCDKKPKSCKDCPNKSFTSPLIYALHKDTHECAMECESCKVEYTSPVQFYYADKCGSNDIPSSTKDLVDQMIKTILLTSEIGIPFRMESHANFPCLTIKKRKRVEATDEEGLVGNWLLNCPTVRARKYSVASRKRIDGEESSDNSDHSVRSSKIVMDGSPQTLPEVEDEKEVMGNLRKRPKLVPTASRPTERPLRKRLSDKLLHPVLKSVRSESSKPPFKKEGGNQRACKTLPLKDNISEHLKKKTTPKTTPKFASPRISPAILSSNSQTIRSKLNSSRSLFKREPSSAPLSSKLRSPNVSKMESKSTSGPVKAKGNAPQPLKSRRSDIPIKMRASFEKRKSDLSASEKNLSNKKLNETITMVSDGSPPDSPCMSRSSTFIKKDGCDSEDHGSTDCLLSASTSTIGLHPGP